MPTPAHGLVKVLWHVQRESRVIMKVYDVTGKRVTTLINNTVKPGSYATVWNGADSHGRKLAGGVYFCTLETNDTKLNRKIVLTN